MTSDDGRGFFDEWPAWAGPLLALAAMICIGGIWVGLPVVSALKTIDAQASGVVDYTPMLAVFIAMTTATITGIFLFMTLRIDRGTRIKAERVATKAMKQLTLEAEQQLLEFSTRSEQILEKADGRLLEKYKEETTPEAIQELVNSRIDEEKLREHVQAVLMVTANGEIVKEYATERAKNLDAESVERLIGLLKEVTERLLQSIEEERGFWAKLFRRGRHPAK